MHRIRKKVTAIHVLTGFLFDLFSFGFLFLSYNCYPFILLYLCKSTDECKIK